MKLQKKILAIAVSSVLSQTAFAEDICDGSDGLNAWGVWCTDGVQPAPAAGLGVTPVALQNLAADISNLDDFGGKTDDAGLPIAVGDASVYYRAAYDVQSTWSSNYENGSSDSFNAEGGSAAGIGTAQVELNDGNPDGSDDYKRSYYNEDDRITGSFADRNGVQVAAFDYFNAEGSYEDDGTYEYNYANVSTGADSGQSRYYGYKENGTDINTNDGDPGFSNTSEGSYERIEGREQSNGIEILKNYWAGAAINEDYESQYSYNGYSSQSSGSSSGTTHAFVGGDLTSADFIAEQVSNQTVEGTYNGQSSFHQQDVAITVNFTERSFEGSWTDGQNFQDVASHDFVASGNLVGQHIVATSITGDGVTGGTLQGSFFGDEAQALGGAYEVNTSTNTFNDVFSTVETGDVSIHGGPK